CSCGSSSKSIRPSRGTFCRCAGPATGSSLSPSAAPKRTAAKAESGKRKAERSRPVSAAARHVRLSIFAHAPQLPCGAYIAFSALAKVVGLVTGLPLDVAADAGLLIGSHRLAGQERVERRPQILSGDGNAVAGAAGVELSAIDQLMALVEQEEVRRT